jgi:SAM-dependent methyltransferase
VSAFRDYAAYYDLLYAERDCVGEVAFVLDRLRAFVPAAEELLELGCGTGAHAFGLAQAGLAVDGIDLSEDMLRVAEARRAALPPEQAARLSFAQGDLCRFGRGHPYDAIVSLFHVMSYVTEEADILAAFAAVRRHLKPGGVFLFDFWHGPAVVATGPLQRAKAVENERFRLLRETRPIWERERDLVRVCYRLQVTDLASGRCEVIEEEHRLRYFFLPALERWLAAAGLRIVETGEWMTGRPVTDETFGAYCCVVPA